MSLRLKSFGFYVRLWHYMLPLLAFMIAAYVRLGVMDLQSHPAELDPWFYFAVLLFITLVWAIAAERQHLCDTDELFRENTGIRKSLTACFATYTVLLSVLFFSSIGSKTSRACSSWLVLLRSFCLRWQRA